MDKKKDQVSTHSILTQHKSRSLITFLYPFTCYNTHTKLSPFSVFSTMNTIQLFSHFLSSPTYTEVNTIN